MSTLTHEGKEARTMEELRLGDLRLPVLSNLTKMRDPLADAITEYEPARHPVLGRLLWRSARGIQWVVVHLSELANSIEERSYLWQYRKPVVDEEKVRAIARAMEWGFAEFPERITMGDYSDEHADSAELDPGHGDSGKR